MWLFFKNFYNNFFIFFGDSTSILYFSLSFLRCVFLFALLNIFSSVGILSRSFCLLIFLASSGVIPKVNVLIRCDFLSLKCKNTTTSASCGWIALLGVLSFLFIFLRLFFICVFWWLFYVMNFYSVYFFYGFLIIALGMKNCFGFEKLLWVRYSITFQMLSLIFYIGVIIKEILFN